MSNTGSLICTMEHYPPAVSINSLYLMLKGDNSYKKSFFNISGEKKAIKTHWISFL